MRRSKGQTIGEVIKELLNIYDILQYLLSKSICSFLFENSAYLGKISHFGFAIAPDHLINLLGLSSLLRIWIPYSCLRSQILLLR